MLIDLPDNVIEVIKTDCEASGLGGCKIVADVIKKRQQDERDVNKAIETHDTKWLYELVNTVSPGWIRFRVMSYLYELEKTSESTQQQSPDA